MDFLSRFLRKSPARELTDLDNHKNTPVSPAVAGDALKTNSGAAPRERKVKASEDSDSSLDYGSASDTENIAHDTSLSSSIQISEAGKKLSKSFLSATLTFESLDTSAASIYEDTENIDPTFDFEQPKPKIFNDLTESFESPDVTLLTSRPSASAFKDCSPLNESGISLNSCDKTLVVSEVNVRNVNVPVNNEKSSKTNGILSSVAEDTGITEENTLEAHVTDIASEAISELETVVANPVNGSSIHYNLDVAHEEASFGKIYPRHKADVSVLTSPDPSSRSHFDVSEIKFESVLLPDKSDPIAFDLKGGGETSGSLYNQVTEDPLDKSFSTVDDFLNTSVNLTRDIEVSTFEGGSDTVILNESALLCETFKNIDNYPTFSDDKILDESVQCDSKIHSCATDLNAFNIIGDLSIINSTTLDETVAKDLSLIKNVEVNNLDSTLFLLDSIESIIEDNSNKVTSKSSIDIDVSDNKLDVDNDFCSDSLSNLSSPLPSLKSSTDSIGVIESRESSVPSNSLNLPIEIDLESNQDFVCGSIDSIGICAEIPHTFDTRGIRTPTNSKNLCSSEEIKELLKDYNNIKEGKCNGISPSHIDIAVEDRSDKPVINESTGDSIHFSNQNICVVGQQEKSTRLNGDANNIAELNKTFEIKETELDNKTNKTVEEIKAVNILSPKSAHSDQSIKTEFLYTLENSQAEDKVVLESTYDKLTERKEIITDIERSQISDQAGIKNIVINEKLTEIVSQDNHVSLQKCDGITILESKSDNRTDVNVKKSLDEFKECSLIVSSNDKNECENVINTNIPLDQSNNILQKEEHIKDNDSSPLEKGVFIKDTNELQNSGATIESDFKLTCGDAIEEHRSEVKVENIINKNSGTTFHITESGPSEITAFVTENNNFAISSSHKEDLSEFANKIKDVESLTENKSDICKDDINIDSKSETVITCSSTPSNVETIVEGSTVNSDKILVPITSDVNINKIDNSKKILSDIIESKAYETITLSNCDLNTSNIDKGNSFKLSSTPPEQGIDSSSKSVNEISTVELKCSEANILKITKGDNFTASPILSKQEIKFNKEVESKTSEINELDGFSVLTISSRQETESDPKVCNEISAINYIEVEVTKSHSEKDFIQQEYNSIVTSFCNKNTYSNNTDVTPTESVNILQEKDSSVSNFASSELFIPDNNKLESMNESRQIQSNNNIAIKEISSVDPVSENLITNNTEMENSACKISETPVKGLKEKKKTNLNFESVDFDHISDPFKSSNKMRLSPSPGEESNVKFDMVKPIPRKLNETISIQKSPVDKPVLNVDATYSILGDGTHNGNHVEDSPNTTRSFSLPPHETTPKVTQSAAVKDHIFVKPRPVCIAPMGTTVGNNNSVNPFTPPSTCVSELTATSNHYFPNDGDLMGLSPCESVSSNGTVTAEPIHDVFSPPNTCDDFMDVDEDLPTEQLFNDPAAFEYLLNRGNNTHPDQKRRDLSKDSLFVKFDPLVSAAAHSAGINSRLPNGPRTPKDLEHSGGGDENSGSSGLAESCSSDSSASAAVMNRSNQSSMMSAGPEQALVNLTIKDPPHHVPVEKPTQVVTPAINWSQSQAASQLTPKTPPNNTQKRETGSGAGVTSVVSGGVASPALSAMERLLALAPATPPPPLPPPPPPPQERSVMDPEVHAELLRVKEMWQAEATATASRLAEAERRLADASERDKASAARLKELSTKDNQMKLVMREYEKNIAGLSHERERLGRQWEAERAALARERDVATAHLAGVEASFNDVHAKYERCKAHILDSHAEADALKHAHATLEDSLRKQEARYESLRQHAMQQIDKLMQESEVMKRAHELEVAKLMALLKKSELTVNTLQENLSQKNKENDHLTEICNGLIQKMSN